MAGRRSGVLTGALVAVTLVLAGGTLLADDLAGVLGGATGPVAWTQEAAAPASAQAGKPAAVTKAGPKAGAKKKAASKKKAAAKKAAAKKAAAEKAAAERAAAGTVSAAGYGPHGPQGPGTCSCAGGPGTTQGGPARVRGPQVVKGSNPPSVRLVVPGIGGVDRGIADTGVHSDGTWHTYTWPQRYHPGSQVTLDAVPSPGQVTLSWYHNGDPAALTYRVGYQPNTWIRSTTRPDTWTTPPIVWVDVPPAAAQGVMSWRLARATRGVEYTFWLEVDLTTPPPEDVLGSTRMLLAQTSHVLVP
ncbi:hypothetical protein [Kineosporia sp. A_224]|uniref:hypothetical protein n=1 Tax=Kineosporia sp. A_224 TaxID=1962180 RepID=UPI000B4AE4E6|nr:hypothetical protein [Kineosporia sp. A_224]